MAEDEQVDSSTTEETDEVKPKAEASAETKKTEDGPKPNYVPQSRLNEMAAQKRAAESKIEELTERLEAMELAQRTKPSEEADPDTKAAQDLIEKTTAPLIEKSLAELRSELRSTRKELADARKESAQTSQAATWSRLCDKFGADPDNKELMAVTAGLSRLDLTNEDALKRALQMLPGAAKETGGRKGASVETAGFDGVPSTSEWVPKSNAEAVKGGLAGKHAKQLTTSEILALRK